MNEVQMDYVPLQTHRYIHHVLRHRGVLISKLMLTIAERSRTLTSWLSIGYTHRPHPFNSDYHIHWSVSCIRTAAQAVLATMATSGMYYEKSFQLESSVPGHHVVYLDSCSIVGQLLQVQQHSQSLAMPPYAIVQRLLLPFFAASSTILSLNPVV